MKSRFARYGLGCLGFAVPVFALDVYMPVEPGKLELDAGYASIFINGKYNFGGGKQDVSPGVEPGIKLFDFQLKYGVMPGLDVEFAWTFEDHNEDLGERAGFVQPQLGVKYAVVPDKIAVFGNLVFPYVTDDFDAEPLLYSMGIEPGVVFHLASDRFLASGAVSYTYYLENEDEFRQGEALNVYLRPGIAGDGKFVVYLGAEYSVRRQSEGGGMGLGDQGQLLTLAPGLIYTVDDRLAFEANVPFFTVAGENSLSVSGFSLQARYTIGP